MRVVVPARQDVPFWVRLALLFVLALSTVIVHLNQAPVLRPAEELISDLRAGGVSKVVHDRDWPAYGTLTWSHGPLSWTQARFDQPDDVWDPETTRLDREALQRRQEAFLARVRAAADPSVEIVRTEGFRGAALLAGSPAYERWWKPFAPVAVTAEALTWLLMLARPNPRYASRWAWFWMFLTGGSLLYVLLEPHPLWRGPQEIPSPAPERLDGTRGFAIAVAVLFGTAMVNA
ncbi:hypothetical protein [Streptosporangium longisporum]|uniref:Uncharacterized protein n=1 Tax=Streptosporangium longisporum TaxID=46187 RepID=A0ABP6KFA9_9ACTN